VRTKCHTTSLRGGSVGIRVASAAGTVTHTSRVVERPAAGSDGGHALVRKTIRNVKHARSARASR